MTRETYEPDEPESEVSKKRLIGSAGAALTILALLLAMTISMNAVTAAFAPGIGGINASFDKLNYNETYTTNQGAGPHSEAHIYPTTTPDTAACEGVNNASADAGGIPVLTADVPGPVGVTGLYLKKTIPVNGPASSVNPVMGGIDNITLNITAAQGEEISLSEPTLEFSSLRADWLNLSGGVAIYENHSNGTTAAPYLGANGEFHVNATNLEMNGATAWAHLVAFDQIDLPDQELSLEFNNKNSAVADDNCNAV